MCELNAADLTYVPRNITVARRIECCLQTLEFICDIQLPAYCTCIILEPVFRIRIILMRIRIRIRGSASVMMDPDPDSDTDTDPDPR